MCYFRIPSYRSAQLIQVHIVADKCSKLKSVISWTICTQSTFIQSALLTNSHSHAIGSCTNSLFTKITCRQKLKFWFCELWIFVKRQLLDTHFKYEWRMRNGNGNSFYPKATNFLDYEIIWMFYRNISYNSYSRIICTQTHINPNPAANFQLSFRQMNGGFSTNEKWTTWCLFLRFNFVQWFSLFIQWKTSYMVWFNGSKTVYESLNSVNYHQQNETIQYTTNRIQPKFGWKERQAENFLESN